MLVDAKCTNCGAFLKVDREKEAAVCEYCGSAFIVEKAIQNFIYHITNNIHADELHVYGGVNIEEKIKNAEQYIEFKDFKKAKEIFKEITDACSSDYRGWWGMLVADTKNLTADKYDSREVDRFFDRFSVTVKDKTLQSQREKELYEYKANCEVIREITKKRQELESAITEKTKSRDELREKIQKVAQQSMTAGEICGWIVGIIIYCVFLYWFFCDLIKYNHFAKFPFVVLLLGVILLICGLAANGSKKRTVEDYEKEISKLDGEVATLKKRVGDLRTEHKKYSRETISADIMKILN